MTHPLPDLAWLREAASKACEFQPCEDDWYPAECDRLGGLPVPDANYIAAVNPVAILALLDTYEKMEAALEPFATTEDFGYPDERIVTARFTYDTLADGDEEILYLGLRWSDFRRARAALKLAAGVTPAK